MNMRKAAMGASLALVIGGMPFVSQAALVPGCEGPDCNFSHFVELIQNVMGFLLAIAVPLFAILFSWAGFLMVTAAGKTGQIESAKKIMTTAFIGFGVALAAYLFVNVLTRLFLKGSPDARDVFGYITEIYHAIV